VLVYAVTSDVCAIVLQPEDGVFSANVLAMAGLKGTVSMWKGRAAACADAADTSHHWQYGGKYDGALCMSPPFAAAAHCELLAVCRPRSATSSRIEQVPLWS